MGTEITSDTPLTLSNYGPTVWPAEAWAALKTALAAKSVDLHLADAAFNYTGETMEIPVSYTRSCYVDGYRESIILPFKPTDIKNASGESAKGDFIFERYVGRSTTEITFAERDFANLEANVPYLMHYKTKGSSGQANYTFVGESLPARPASLGETFVGTYETVPHSAETTRYVLAVDEANSKDYFGQLASTASIAPYRAYLEIPTYDPSGAPVRFSIAFGGSDEGGATGIEPAAQSDGLWGEEGAICLSVGQAQQVRIYGVDGRLVRTEWVDGQARLPMPQGLYLVNNRKVVVR